MSVVSSSDLIGAHMVWDGAGTPTIPEQLLPSGPDPMGQIKAKGQFDGSAVEQVCEIAGRVCYDSFGAGRDSVAYHGHIQEVGHHSVLRHVNLTFEIPTPNPYMVATYLSCRPGVLVTDVRGDSIRATVSLQSAVEWQKWSAVHPFLMYRDGGCEDSMDALGRAIRNAYHIHAPIVMHEGLDLEGPAWAGVTTVMPNKREEMWLTLLLTGSRGFSHELVRHTYRTAPSQRSTRYVDENGSPWVPHPLVTQFASDCPDEFGDLVSTQEDGKGLIFDGARWVYKKIVDRLQPWLAEKGANKLTARKQARGAARGYLGNALYTEVVFSASVEQWLCMLGQRASGPADAEIREVFCKTLPLLQGSRYGAEFDHLELRPAEDGIGQVVTDAA